jgi:pimeloyl-ACP methyl ester carboxylesterase
MQYKEMKLLTKEGLKLQGWFMHQHVDPESFTTVVFFHENAGNIGLRLDWFELMYKHLKVNIVCVAYRGYSKSEGEPNEDHILDDVDLIIDYCKNEKMINQDKVFLFGRSLGGAVAIHTLRKLEKKGCHYFKGAVIENTFTNISSMADVIFPMFKAIPRIKKAMLRLRWESDQ